MQVSNPNNVKIYNLSCGKSLPEWLSEKKRRKLLKKNIDIRRRIELIQNFDMPAVSTSIKVSNDGQYILATGIYKPRVKCFDVNNLSLKFERCFDSEVVAFQILSDDYSKLVFLHCDRNIEFHAAPGKYYKLRIPRFGRDITYHYPSCDLMVVGDSHEIYRLNLERGQFLKSYECESLAALNKCSINPVHQLVVVGTQDGKIESWDPRSKSRVATLNCALDCINQQDEIMNLQFHDIRRQTELKFPNIEITALNFQDALTMAVGTSNGQILLYDIRSNKPFMVKDHMYGLPIKNVQFHDDMNLIYSMDSSIVKIWEKNSGKLYTSIEASAHADFNDLCTVPNTGMLFLACEAPKMQTYYIPSLGPAPRWAHFLDNLTEELEELNYETIYDDYKFVTSKELDELGLSHLAGTNLLRAYMHGYFIDVRLWCKAKQLAEPFSYDEYKKKKIREKINEDRISKLMQIRKQQEDKLPKVNRELAMKYQQLNLDNKNSKKAIEKINIMKDDRFKELFNNSDFQIDQNSEEFARQTMGKIAIDRKKLKKGKKIEEDDSEVERSDVDVSNHGASDDELFGSDDADGSSADERNFVKKRRKAEGINREKKINILSKDTFEKHLDKKEYMKRREQTRVSLGDRLKREQSKNTEIVDLHTGGSRGNKELTFTVSKKRKFTRR